MTEPLVPQEKRDDPVFAGRIDILYALGRHYLSLPFAVLCVPAALIAHHPPGVLPLMPLLLQLAVVIAAEQLTTAYKRRPAGSDPHFWARRNTFVSAISGASGSPATKGCNMTAATSASWLTPSNAVSGSEGQLAGI